MDLMFLRSPSIPALGLQCCHLSPFFTGQGATQARKSHQVTTATQQVPSQTPGLGFIQNYKLQPSSLLRIWNFLTIKGQACLSQPLLPALLGGRLSYF